MAAGLSLVEWPRVAWRRTVMPDAIPQSRKRHSNRYRQETTKERKWTQKCSIQGKSGKEDTGSKGKKERQTDWRPTAPIIPSHEL